MKREENQTIEYKASWHEKYLEWICGYANAKGGTLYIGVEDVTKKPVGVKNVNKLREAKKAKEPEVEEAPTEKECPYCFTKININATRCPHCTSKLD